jgi:ABC-type multidrug transport system fused ATPase/permease subunit
VLTLSAAAINILLVLIAVVKRDSISSGVLAVALSMAANMCFQLMVLVVEWTSRFPRSSAGRDSANEPDVEMCITSVERIQEYIELPSQEDTRGSIRFMGVNARYQPTLPLALKNLNFAIKPGQRVGICGRSGSGKSTMLGVLWRLIDIEDEGEILVNGLDIRDLPLREYRSAMSIVPQGTPLGRWQTSSGLTDAKDPLLLEVSLRENLDPEGLHTDAELWDALEKSHVRTRARSTAGLKLMGTAQDSRGEAACQAGRSHVWQ